MRNRLTLCSMIFALLLVGRIGHVGTLGNLAWYWIVLPLALDTILDFTIAMGWQDYFVQGAIFKVKNRKMNRIIKQTAERVKSTL